MTSSTICSHHRIRTVLLMCVVLLSASLHAQAQNKETRINLNIRNATLESFVKQLENATGFSFIYGEEVKLTHRITLEMKQKNISEILQRAFENEPITFEISGKHILLHKRPVPQKPVSRKFTISGYVTDGASSETLIGANILESRRSTGTATNPFGFYSLTLPEGETELVFSYLGYESRHSRFELTKDTLLNVRLDSNNQLAEVVVLSDKREAGIESTAMGAHEIPMTQIRHTPSILGEADLLKTIQLMPGVQAGMEGFAGMYVRGGGPDQNLVMLDGIPVYNADHLLGVFSIFTPEAVKNTTFFKSSFPARYGGRLSSIVDVRTNDGDMHKYHGAFSIGLLTDKLHIEGPIWKERTSFSFSARAIPTLFFKNLIVDKDDTYSDKYNYYFYDVNAKVNHKFSDRSRIFLSFYKGKDHYHYDSYYHGDNYDNSIKNYSKDNSHLNWGNTIAYGRWNYVFNSKLFCNTTVSYNKYEMGLDGNMEDTYTVANKVQDRYYYSSKFNSGIRDWSARMDFDYTPMPQHHIKFGAEYIHHTFRPGIATSKIQDIDNGALQEDTVYNTSNSHAMRGQEISLYAEDNFNVNARLSLNAGVRTSLFHTQGKSYYSLQPRLSARYDLGQGYSAKASYTCMAQYVHLLSSTPLSMPTDLWVPITKDISPMYANQFSIGGYYSGLPGWEFSVEGYYKQMKHILEYQDGVSFFGTSTNWEEKVEMGEGRSFGLELMAQKTLGKTTGWLAYTLSKTDHRFKSGTINQGRWFPYKYDRRHSISLNLSHKFSDRIDAGASWIFNTGGCITIPEKATIIIRPDGSIEETGYISRRNNYRLPASHRLNLGVNFNKKTKHGMRTWNISIYNAYNAMNPNIVYSKYKNGYNVYYDDFYESIYHGNTGQKKAQTVIKKITILPCIPSVTYTYRFKKQIRHMKTKMKLHLIIYITIVGFLTACENEIPYNPGQQDPQIIMNALLETGQAENDVYLHLGEGYSIEHLNEATLFLYINGKIAETPKAVSPEEIYGHLEGELDKDIYESLLKSIRFKKYRLTSTLHPGDNIRLEATAENGKYHASAEVTVPQPIESLHVDTCLAYLREYSGQTLYRQYKITLQDRPNEKNYYRLDIWNDRSYYCKWKEYLEDENGSLIKVEDEDGSWHWASIPRDTTILAPRQNEIINREDVILTDGHPGNYDDEENELFPTINNKYNIFNDNTFRDSYATLKVYTPLYQEYYPVEGHYYDHISRKQTITVRLLSITEAEYRYLKALNCLDDGDYDDALMEPISLPCNVIGGLGFVGVCSESRVIIELPETVWQ